MRLLSASLLLTASLLSSPASALLAPNPSITSYIKSTWISFRSTLSDYRLSLHSPSNDLSSLHAPTWLSTLPSTLPITSITIPGTHDTMSYSPALGPIGQTQSYNLSVQLNAGIRYIDIRVRHVGNRFSLVHNFLPTGQRFSSVIEELGRFLRENEGEFVIVRLKDEGFGKPDFVKVSHKVSLNLKREVQSDEGEVYDILSDHEGYEASKQEKGSRSLKIQRSLDPSSSSTSLQKRLVSTRPVASTFNYYRFSNKKTSTVFSTHLYTASYKLDSSGQLQPVIPTLSQLRGKFLLLTEFANAPHIGIPWSSGVIDLEDDWYVPQPSAMQHKWDVISTHMDKVHSTLADKKGRRPLFLTHLSGNSPKVWARIVANGDEKGMSGRGMNERTLEKIGGWLEEKGERRNPGGIVITDFAGSGLISGIIALNGRRERRWWEAWCQKVKEWVKGWADI